MLQIWGWNVTNMNSKEANNSTFSLNYNELFDILTLVLHKCQYKDAISKRVEKYELNALLKQ